MAWDPHSPKVDVILCSDQLILARVETSDHRTFHISVVYGQNHMVGRRSLWTDMRFGSGGIGDGPWIQLGDFNVVRRSDERLVGFDSSAACEFNDCLAHIGMDDMPSKGY